MVELTRLAEEVREAGVALDGELTLIALNGLDLSYEAFVMAWFARADEVSFAIFQRMLQSHEERFMQAPATSMILMANVVSNDTVICQICLKKGHSMIACFNRHNELRFHIVVEKKSRFRPRQGPKQSNTVNAVWYRFDLSRSHENGGSLPLTILVALNCSDLIFACNHISNHGRILW